MAAWLLVIGEREALAWILREERMAFAASTRSPVGRLHPGDLLYLLTTRGCWHNPTRDRTRIIGSARVASAVASLPKPLKIAGREFSSGCALRVETLTAYRQGVEVAPLVDRLHAFPMEAAWAMALRQTLVPLDIHDTKVIAKLLDPLAAPAAVMRDRYVKLIKPVGR